MRKLTFCFIAIFCTSACYGQSALKLGASYRYSSGDGYTSQFQVDVPAYFNLLPHDRYVEAGLDAFRLSQKKVEGNTTGTTFTSDFSPYFEYGVLTGSSVKKARFKLGARAILNNSFQHYNPNTSIAFRNSYFTSGIRVAVVPAVFIKMRDRLYFDLVIPVNLVTWRFEHSRMDNPAVPIADQRSNSWVGDFLPPVYQVKMGIVYLLNQR